MAASRNGDGLDRLVPDRLGIAEQVILSAGNILVAAGFSRAEIRSFFQQAADQLEPLATGVSPGSSGQGDRGQGDRGQDNPLRAAFDTCPAVQALARLEAKARALPSPEAPDASLRDHFDLAMQMVPLVAEAQDWLRRAAAEAGLAIHADREVAGTAGAADGRALYYEDFADLLGFAFSHFGALCRQLAARDDDEALSFMLGFLTDNGVIITRQLAETIRQSTGVLASSRS